MCIFYIDLVTEISVEIISFEWLLHCCLTHGNHLISYKNTLGPAKTFLSMASLNNKELELLTV